MADVFLSASSDVMQFCISLFEIRITPYRVTVKNGLLPVCNSFAFSRKKERKPSLSIDVLPSFSFSVYNQAVCFTRLFWGESLTSITFKTHFPLDFIRNFINYFTNISFSRRSCMPEISIVFFRDDNNTVPALDWILSLESKAQTKCLARIQRLQQRGHELRRPEANYLRDEIYELRISHLRVNYRILYFFHERTAAVLAHGIVKESQVPSQEIERAIERKMKFQQNPDRYTNQGEV